MKFKCKDCRHSFELKNGDEEVCPNCKSDNIQPAGTAMSIIGKFSLFLGMAAVGYFVTTLVFDTPDEKKIPGGQIAEEKELPHKTGLLDNVVADAENTDTITSVEPLEPIDSAEFIVSSQSLNMNGFSFVVQCNRIPIDYQIEQYRLFLNESDTEPVITAEANGKFSSGTYFSSSGIYYVQAVFINNNTTTRKPIKGIVKPVSHKEETKPSKMEMAELQSKIDKSVAERNGGSPVNRWYKPNGGDVRVSKKVNVSLSVANNVNGEEKHFVGIQPMIKYAQAKKIGIKVLSVSYNDKGEIEAIEIATTK